jgi:hypothetical protein
MDNEVDLLAISIACMPAKSGLECSQQLVPVNVLVRDRVRVSGPMYRCMCVGVVVAM